MSEIRSRQESQAQRLMAMGQMAASLAHEIRNPLGSMELFCSLLKKDLKGQPELLQAAEQIHLGIRLLDRIISNCLQFTRDIQPRKKRFTDVRPLLETALAYAQTKADDCNVQLSIETSGTGEVFVDEFLLQQVLVNLLLNAVEAVATNDTGNAVRLLSNITPAGWEIRVEDEGCGISPEAQAQIFDPFFTTKQQGTGLGLTIVHSIVTSHGGEIEIFNADKGGAVVRLFFPKPDALSTNVRTISANESHLTGG